MKSRKDSRGRVLRKGESQREKYYIYQYTDVTHKRRVIYAKDLPELREKERDIMRDLADGLNTQKRYSVTLNEAFDAYFSGRKELKYSTRVCYQYLYNHYVRSSFGNRLLARLRYSDIRNYYLTLAEQGLSKKTLRMIHSLISQVMDFAVRDEILRANPAEGVMTELTKRLGLEEHRRHALTREQQSAFMRYVKAHPKYEKWYPLFTVLLGTGCRIGEVLGLCWEDIDFEQKRISVTRSLQYRTLESGKVGHYISTPKSVAGKRTIPMMQQVEAALQQEKENQKRRNREIRSYTPPVVDGYTDFVFTGGKCLYESATVNRAIRGVIASYNDREQELAALEQRTPLLLPDFTCHNLRHTFCTRFCENETNVKVIQDIMGHADVGTTLNIYAEVTEEKKRESMSNLENKIMIM